MAASRGTLLVACVALYAISGWCQPILIDAIRLAASESGATATGHFPVLLPMLCNSLGMALVGTAGPRGGLGAIIGRPELGKAQRNTILRRLGALTCLDFISGALIIAGQLMVPSVIFVLLYASCVMWTALISRLVLRQKLTWIQWVAVALICAGLSLEATVSSLQHARRQQDPGPGPEYRVLGAALILAGSLLHSAMFVAAEHVVSRTPGITMLSACTFMGAVESAVLVLYHTNIFVAGGPGYDAALHGALRSFGRYGVLVGVDAVHAMAFFSILGHVGATATGVLKGLQMVVVLVGGSTLFCARDAAECITVVKAASVGVVSVGLLLFYSYGTGARGRTHGGVPSIKGSHHNYDDRALASAGSTGGAAGGMPGPDGTTITGTLSNGNSGGGGGGVRAGDGEGSCLEAIGVVVPAPDGVSLSSTTTAMGLGVLGAGGTTTAAAPPLGAEKEKQSV